MTFFPTGAVSQLRSKRDSQTDGDQKASLLLIKGRSLDGFATSACPFCHLFWGIPGGETGDLKSDILPRLLPFTGPGRRGRTSDASRLQYFGNWFSSSQYAISQGWLSPRMRHSPQIKGQEKGMRGQQLLKCAFRVDEERPDCGPLHAKCHTNRS
jgi:hypothetical protein